MKKLTAIVMVAMLVVALALPTVMAASPTRDILVIKTIDDMPEATADSPDFIFVQDEGTTYVKYDDPETGLTYIPEDDVPGIVDYEIIKGAGETWTKGSDEGFIVASDRVEATDEEILPHFVALIIDGEIVDESNYTAYEGSIEIALTAAFMETLDVGAHAFTIQADDGSAAAEFEVKASQAPSQDSETETETETETAEITETETETETETAAGEGPADTNPSTPGGNQPSGTGDDSNTSMWTAIALIALGAIGVVALTLVKTRKSTEK